MVAVVAVVAVVGAAVAAFVFTRTPGKASTSAAPTTTSIHYPSAWDPRIAPIAEQTERLRKLTFRHPVEVRFLTDTQYTSKATADSDRVSLDASNRVALAAALARFRSVGLLSGQVDLAEAERQLTDIGTLAFYDSADKRVYIRGTKVTAAVRITLVHELTHVLQDQHFDLRAMERKVERAHGDPLAIRALVEGDAEDVGEQAVAELTPSEKREYVSSQADFASGGDAKRLQGLPTVLVDTFAAPYDFGKQFVRIIRLQGGQQAVDAAFRNPPIAFADVWNPFRFLAGTETLTVAPPRLPKGATLVHSGPSGSLLTYLILAERMPPFLALEAADAWNGDETISYRLRGRVCTDIRMRAGNEKDDATLQSAWRIWTMAMPGADATWKPIAGNGVAIHSCDPGPGVDLHVSQSGDRALVYPVGRLQLAETVLEQSKAGKAIPMSASAAFCFADAVVRIAPADALGGKNESWQPDATQEHAMTTARDACRSAYP